MPVRPLPLIATRNSASDVLDLALLLVAAAGAAVAAWTGLWWLAIAAALPSLGADLLRHRRPARLRRAAQRLQLNPPARSLVRNGLLVAVLAAEAPDVRALDLTALLVAVMAVHLGQVAYLLVGGAVVDLEVGRVQWRNLDVDGRREGPPPIADAVGRLVGVDGIRVMTAGEVLLLAGVALSALGLQAGAVAGAAVSVLVVVLADLAAVREWRRPERLRAARHGDDALRDAVQALRPEVVFYFASPASGTYALGVWADVINAMRRPTLVVVREAVHLEGLTAIAKPMVVPLTVTALERVVPESVAVALYSTNVTKNNDLVRIPGPMHAFIGHGDSDKVGSFSPLNRLYDEIWVAGQAAIDRYAAVDEGIDLSVLRAVGRPQLAEIARAVPADPAPETAPPASSSPSTGAVRVITAAIRTPRPAAPAPAADASAPAGARPPTVLYAPTWEGFFDEADYSSVAALGVGIVRTALDAGARVLFKPHPLTGNRLPAARAALEEIEAILARAGGGSRLVEGGPDALYRAFNEADLLVADISSVITDFLASRKPYAVTNRHDVPAADFVARFPSAGAAYLVGPTLAGLPGALRAVAGDDPARDERMRLATHLLGDRADPLAAFLDEVDAFVGRSQARMRSLVRA